MKRYSVVFWIWLRLLVEEEVELLELSADVLFSRLGSTTFIRSL